MSRPVLKEVEPNTVFAAKAQNRAPNKDPRSQTTLFLNSNLHISQTRPHSEDVTLVECETSGDFDFSFLDPQHQDSRPASTGSNFDGSLSIDYTNINELLNEVVEKSDLTDLVRRELFFYTQTGMLTYENFDQLYSKVNAKSGSHNIEIRAICASSQRVWNTSQKSSYKVAICPKRCIAFTKEYSDHNRCPYCNSERDNSSYLIYNSVRPLIGSIMSNPFSRAQIELSSLHSGNEYNLFVTLMVEQKVTVSNVDYDIVSISFDNLYKELRSREESINVSLAYPCVDSKNQIQYFLAPLIEDLNDLYHHGLRVRLSEHESGFCKCTVSSILGADLATTASMISAIKGPDPRSWGINNAITTFAEIPGVNVPESFPSDLKALLFETIYAKGIHQIYFAKDSPGFISELGKLKQSITKNLSLIQPNFVHSLLKKSSALQVKGSSWQIGHKLFYAIYYVTCLKARNQGVASEATMFLVELNAYLEVYSCDDLTDHTEEFKCFIKQLLDNLKNLCFKYESLKKLQSVPCHMLLNACDTLKRVKNIENTYCRAKDMSLPWVRNLKSKTMTSVGGRLLMKSIHDCLWFMDFKYDVEQDHWKVPAKWIFDRHNVGHRKLQSKIQKRVMCSRKLRSQYLRSVEKGESILDNIRITNYGTAVLDGEEFKIGGSKTYAKIQPRYKHGSAIYVKIHEFVGIGLDEFPSKFAIVENLQELILKHKLPIANTDKKLVVGRTYDNSSFGKPEIVEVEKYTWKPVSMIPLDGSTSFVYDPHLSYDDVISK
ncbi:hypothetical protein KL936_003376 [Ogataea polymorpha]|nr:hypothetical protein KL936_003376 [Ogataea polymorpha]